MRRQSILSFAILLASVGGWFQSAQAIVVRSDQKDSSYQTLGSSPVFESVGRFDGSTGRSGFLASGTLIAPDWVLTAAHVVEHAKTLSFTIGGQTYEVDRAVPNPKWDGNLWSGYDIGLVHLSRPVTNVTPAALYTGSSELNHADTVVGYGKTGTGDSGGKTADGRKRAAQNVISQIENNRLLVAEFDAPLALGNVPFKYARTLPLEGLIAPGDSGGGLFITTPTGTYLAGVNSFVGSDYGAPRSIYGNFSGHTRVSAFRDWIESLVRDGAAAEPEPETPPAPLIPCPEPGSLALLAAAVVFLGVSRRLLRRARS